jgi:hypothetical protein
VYCRAITVYFFVLPCRYDNKKYNSGKDSSGKDDDSGKKETPVKKPKYEYNYKDSEAEAQVRADA